MTSLEEKLVVKQEWDESERGWGIRPDGYSLHLSVEDRQQFIKDYWGTMPDSVPDEYSRPSGDPFWIKIDLETYHQIEESKNGIRRYR
ncbi:MAG: hypothetical protein WCV90_06305 [Candidatus Woesearchaeota archaeon]|jgi:hypothetical protein